MTTEMIAYKALRHSDLINARVTGRADGVEHLADSIAAVGLLQPLAVRRCAGLKGKAAFEVLDGNRRLDAIAVLIERKQWTARDLIPALILDKETDAAALEASMIANMERVPVGEVDQYERFAALQAGGLGPKEIAAHFGLPLKSVQQRLALGRLAPEILAALRTEEISEEAAQAFTLTGDHDLQRSVFASLQASPYGLGAYGIKSALGIKADEGSLKFVGADAYKKAGGAVVTDLFGGQRYVSDAALLVRLANEKLALECERLRAAGWQWAEPSGSLPQDSWRWLRVEPASGESLSPDEMAVSGCVVEIGHDGKLLTREGIIRPSEAPGPVKPGQEAPQPDAPSGPRLSGVLRATLGGTMGRALADTISLSPDLAQAIASASMLMQFNDPQHPVVIKASGLGYGPLRTEFEGLGGEAFGPTLQRVLALTRERQERLFACLVASAVSTVTFASAGGDLVSMSALQLADELDCDLFNRAMAQHFDPVGFFLAAPKAVADEAILELTPAGSPRPPARKPEAAGLAAELAARYGWLPVELRHPHYRGGAQPLVSDEGEDA